MSKIEGRLVLSLILVLLAMLPAGIVFAAEPVKIGIVWPFTGPIASSGSYLRAGIEIGRDKINSEGGILGRPVKLFIEDGANDPAQSVSAAEKLVTREKIDVFIGAWGSSPTLAVSASVTKKYGVPHIAVTASSGKVTVQDGKRPNPWLFRMSPTSRTEAEAVEKYLPKMGFSKVALLSVNNDWGRGAAAEFTTVVERSGGAIVATEVVTQEATDFLTQLTKIKNSGANSVIVTTDMVQLSTILKQCKQLGMTLKILATGATGLPEGLVQLGGPEAAEGVYGILFFAPWFPELAENDSVRKEIKWFVDEYLRRGNSTKGFGEFFRGYDALKTIKAAMELAGTTEKEKVRTALHQVDTWGLAGRIRFDEFGQGSTSVYVIQVKSSKPFIPEFMKRSASY